MDILRTVTLSAGGRPIPRVNLADPTGLTVYTERGSFQLAPPTKTPNWSRSSRRFGGSVQSGESHDNWTALASWWVKGGGNPATVIANAEQLMGEIDDITGLNPLQPRYLEWRPDGAPQSTFFEIRGSGLFNPRYDWAAFAGAQMLKLDMSWPIAPLAHGLPLDIGDPLDVDSRADYTIDRGNALTYNAPAIGATYGTLAVTGVPAVQLIRHTIRGYTYDDVQTTAQITTGTAAPTAIAVTLCHLDSQNYLLAQLTATALTIYKCDGGTLTSLGSTAATLASAHTYWLRIRKEGNRITAELFSPGPPSPLGTPTATVHTLLSGSDATKFGAGIKGNVGIRLDAPPADTTIGYFEALPYTYQSGPPNLPGSFDLRAVPGTAPPRMDLRIAAGGTPLPPVNGMSVSAVAGGALTVGNSYTYGIAAMTPFGETSILQLLAQGPIVGGQQTLHVDWTSGAVVGALSYHIYRFTGSTATPSDLRLLNTVNATVTTYNDDGSIAPSLTQAPSPTNTAYPGNPIWGLIAWHRRPLPHNLVWNGDFETDVDGWSTAVPPAYAAIYAAATSITRGTTQPAQGTAHAIIAVPATLNAQANFLIQRRFKAGTTYTITLQAASPTLTDSFAIGFQPIGIGGAIGGAWGGNGTPVNLTATYQTITLTFTADTDAEGLYLFAVHGAATAGNIYIDTVQAYQTANGQPTLPTQTAGRGALPPLGIFDGAGIKPADLAATGCTVTTGQGPASSIIKSLLIAATAGTAGSLIADWWIDPALLAQGDDFARGTIAIEAYWRGCMPPSVPNALGSNYIQNPILTLSAISDPAAGSVIERFTQEFGTNGRQPIQSNVASTAIPAARLSRLGTLILPVDPAIPVRWKLKLAHRWSAANTAHPNAATGLTTDYLLLVPARRRASGPTGKPAGDGTYPIWQQLPPSVQAIKTIKSDLRGRIALPTGPPILDAPDTGLSGSPLELQAPAGNAQLTSDHRLLIALSNLVPDDPTATAGETLVQPVSVHAAITPRYRFARSL